MCCDVSIKSTKKKKKWWNTSDRNPSSDNPPNAVFSAASLYGASIQGLNFKKEVSKKKVRLGGGGGLTNVLYYTATNRHTNIKTHKVHLLKLIAWSSDNPQQ